MNVLLFFSSLSISRFYFWLLVSTTYNFFVYVYASSLLFSCFVDQWYGSLTRFYHLARATNFHVCARARVWNEEVNDFKQLFFCVVGRDDKRWWDASQGKVAWVEILRLFPFNCWSCITWKLSGKNETNSSFILHHCTWLFYSVSSVARSHSLARCRCQWNSFHSNFFFLLKHFYFIFVFFLRSLPQLFILLASIFDTFICLFKNSDSRNCSMVWICHCSYLRLVFVSCEREKRANEGEKEKEKERKIARNGAKWRTQNV